MDITKARAHAVHLMREHGLPQKGWMFEFDRAKHRLGLCDNSRKLITISWYFTSAATKYQFDQAMLHEIAHALLPITARHGEQWKQKAKEIGYKGKRLAHNPYSERWEREEAKRVQAKIDSLRKGNEGNPTPAS